MDLTPPKYPRDNPDWYISLEPTSTRSQPPTAITLPESLRSRFRGIMTE